MPGSEQSRRSETRCEGQANRQRSSAAAFALSIVCVVLAVVFLISLHVLSPEYSPAWRMISEYANGHFPWVLSLMFIAYGLGILSLTYAIRSQAATRASKVGLLLLAVSGVAAVSAAHFDLNQVALHELAGIVGIVCLPIGAVLATNTLVRTEPWSDARKPLLWMANLTWIGVLLWMASFVLMVVTFLHVLGTLPTSVPNEVPPGAIALVGWTNRLLVLLAWAWVAAVAWVAIKARERGPFNVVRLEAPASPE